MAGRATLRVATINLRNTADRWPERREMLADQLAALDADLVAVQELRVFPPQGWWVRRAANRRRKPGTEPYWLVDAPKTGLLRFREAVGALGRLSLVAQERIDLHGGNRVAARVRVAVPGGFVDFYATHLHHPRHDDELRLAQAEQLLEAIEQRPGAAVVLAGDMNATPDEPAARLLARHLRSAHVAAHGHEPIGTVPTPLNSEWGQPPKVIDYIFVGPGIAVADCHLAFDAAHPLEPRLSASDHYGLVADLSVGWG